ncbi:hypothetical protein [Pseudomonas protegens]
MALQALALPLARCQAPQLRMHHWLRWVAVHLLPAVVAWLPEP